MSLHTVYLFAIVYLFNEEASISNIYSGEM